MSWERERRERGGGDEETDKRRSRCLADVSLHRSARGCREYLWSRDDKQAREHGEDGVWKVQRFGLDQFKVSSIFKIKSSKMQLDVQEPLTLEVSGPRPDWPVETSPSLLSPSSGPLRDWWFKSRSSSLLCISSFSAMQRGGLCFLLDSYAAALMDSAIRACVCKSIRGWFRNASGS